MEALSKNKKSLIGSFIREKKARYRDKKFKKEYIYYLFRLLTHPIDAFNEIKYEKKGSLLVANLMVILLTFEKLAINSKEGFLFSQAETNNIWLTIISTVGVLLLWSICNWAISTLFDGEGTFKEIWIMSSYSLIPMVLINPIIILISNIASLDEAIIVSSVQSLATAWMILLLFLGIMISHQFTVTKTLLLSLFTIVVIFAVILLGLIFFSITQQIINFIKTIFIEIIV